MCWCRTRSARSCWRRRSRTTRTGCAGCARRWCVLRLRWSRSSGLMGCWSIGCWRRGCGCWRCIPTRSRRRAIGSAPRAGSPTGLIVLCCASWPGPTGTAFGFWSRTLIRPRRCGRSSEPARISSGRGWRWPISFARSSSVSGPARSVCSAIWTARSRSRSWPGIPAPATRAGWVSSAWPPS